MYIVTIDKNHRIQVSFPKLHIIPMKKLFEWNRTFCLFLIFLFTTSVQAQMFSVEDPESRSRISNNSLSFGFDFLNMEMRSELDPEIPQYQISDPIYRFRLVLPGIEAYAGLKNNTGAADTLNYLNLGANISGALPLAGNNKVGISLPLWLSTDYIRVRSTSRQQSEGDHFRKSSASIGAGAEVYYNMSNNIRFKANVVPQIGFTVSSIGSDSGQMSSLNSKFRLYLDNIYRRFGLVAGYNYTWRRYSGSEERFNYDIYSNSVSIGVSF